jgi:hypothetical protein
VRYKVRATSVNGDCNADFAPVLSHQPFSTVGQLALDAIKL